MVRVIVFVSTKRDHRPARRIITLADVGASAPSRRKPISGLSTRRVIYDVLDIVSNKPLVVNPSYNMHKNHQTQGFLRHVTTSDSGAPITVKNNVSRISSGGKKENTSGMPQTQTRDLRTVPGDRGLGILQITLQKSTIRTKAWRCVFFSFFFLSLLVIRLAYRPYPTPKYYFSPPPHR